MKTIIQVDEGKFCEWLQGAWVHQNDGWNRDYWCDISDMSFWDTTETKSTSFENGDSVVLICHVSGDNNADYNDICTCCSSFDERCLNNCDCWARWSKENSSLDFEDMQFECMENVGWIDNIKQEIEERLGSEYYIEWV